MRPKDQQPIQSQNLKTVNQLFGKPIPPFLGIPLQRSRQSYLDLCPMILNLSSTILTKVGIRELGMGCNGVVYPNLAKTEEARINFDS